MDQEKIGKFIAKCRKDKKLTQSDLASKLGVSDKSVGNWENGRNMPDLSLFNALCIELDISINELLSGERLSSEDNQKGLEENIINVIDYSVNQTKKRNHIIGIVLIIVGILMSFIAMVIFPSESSGGSIYSLLGAIISLVGVAKFTKYFTYGKRLLLNFLYFASFFALLLVVDFIGVVVIKQAPRFADTVRTVNNVIEYQTPFYNVFRVNFDTKNEYYVFDYDKEYTAETVPNVPVNRSKTGIDNLLKYKSEKLEDNDNLVNLLKSLPLSDMKYHYDVVDSRSLEITYEIKEEYFKEYLEFERSLIYNVVSIFTIIDSVEYIRINVFDRSYLITRDELKEYFPNINEILQSDVKRDYWVDLFEAFITDNEYIRHNYKILFVNQNVLRTKKIEVMGFEEKVVDEEIVFERYVKKVITDIDDIKMLIQIVSASEAYSENTFLTSEGATWEFVLYDEDNKVIATLYGWQARSIGFSGKEYKISDEDVIKLHKLGDV